MSAGRERNWKKTRITYYDEKNLKERTTMMNRKNNYDEQLERKNNYDDIEFN